MHQSRFWPRAVPGQPCTNPVGVGLGPSTQELGMTHLLGWVVPCWPMGHAGPLACRAYRPGHPEARLSLSIQNYRFQKLKKFKFKLIQIQLRNQIQSQVYNFTITFKSDSQVQNFTITIHSLQFTT
jgi:hypothetical protein